jgi:hypothetical protein
LKTEFSFAAAHDTDVLGGTEINKGKEMMDGVLRLGKKKQTAEAVQ